MSLTSKIEWTEATWNPVTGCTKISNGCKNCYAFSMAKRLQAMGNPRYKNGFKVTLHTDLIDLPLKWKKPKKIFVNSMSDLFHESVPFEFIKEIFKTMNTTKQHNFQILTKRSERLKELSPYLKWSPNIWAGVTVEDFSVLNRVDDLKKVQSNIRFISFEPLLSNISYINLKDIHWVIAGGESGSKARPMQADWVRNIRDQCLEQNVPFFFKQWGGFHKSLNGRLLKTWDEYPNVTYSHL